MKRFTQIIIVLAGAILLSGCHPDWNVKVDLTPEARQSALQAIETAKTAIKNFSGPAGEIPWRDIIDQAAAYEKLGEIGSSIDLYKSWLDKGFKTRSIINNLGRDYERVGEYDLAVVQYKRMVDEYFDTTYLYDITWAYIRAAQASKNSADALKYRKEAEKVFNAWQMEFHKTDEETQGAIKKLRELEQAKKS